MGSKPVPAVESLGLVRPTWSGGEVICFGARSPPSRLHTCCAYPRDGERTVVCGDMPFTRPGIRLMHYRSRGSRLLVERQKNLLKRTVVAVPMFTVLLAGAPALAGNAAADDAASTGTWTMPDVKGSILQTAVDDVRSAAGDAPIQFQFVPRHVNQVVYNLTNWAVCYTSPNADRDVSSAKKQKVILSLRRLNEKC